MLAAVPRAGGGIGRRARLRALWTEWSVEVRVLFGALEKPRSRGAFLLSGANIQAPPPSSSGNSVATNRADEGVSRAWHKEALRDAGLRDMPLHALHHSASAAWLSTERPLMYVQGQLGHAQITIDQEVEAAKLAIRGEYSKRADARAELLRAWAEQSRETRRSRR